MKNKLTSSSFDGSQLKIWYNRIIRIISFIRFFFSLKFHVTSKVASIHVWRNETDMKKPNYNGTGYFYFYFIIRKRKILKIKIG